MGETESESESDSGSVQTHVNLPWLTTVHESLMTESPSTPVLLAGISTVDPSIVSTGSLLSITERVSASTVAGRQRNMDGNLAFSSIKMLTNVRT